MKYVSAYGAQNATSLLAPMTIQRREKRTDDVVIDILYSGVCHSDLHMARNDWGISLYPIVPGHEIVGRVREVGEKVSKFKIGDLVGVGCMVDSCRECSSCQAGLEQYCFAGNTMTYGSPDRHDGLMTYGGYSKEITVSQDFVVKVPENLNIQGVAPLLCAGITTWSPLRHWNVGKGSRVAVIGLGGLGHMAIKLAKALGAEVSLFSRSMNKIDDAKKLGVDKVILSTNESEMKSVHNQFDLIIDTVPYDHDIMPYIPTLDINGTLVFVGLVGDLTHKINTFGLLGGRRSISASMIGGIKETQELLDFCGEHNIISDYELIKMDYINEANERMLKSDVKYRFVIDITNSF